MALVGTYVALSKPLTAAIPVFVLAFLRFAIAAVAMVPWTLPARAEPRLSRTEHRLFFVMSFFGNFLFSICMLYGVSMTTATAAGVILATLPAVVALLSWLVLRERLSRRVMLAVALAVGGIALLQLARPAGESTRGATLLGNLLMFGAVVCEAIYVIVAKRLAVTRTPLRVSALINVWGLVLITPFGLWQLTRFDLGTVGPACLLFPGSQPVCRLDVGLGPQARAGQPGRRIHGCLAARGHGSRLPGAR
jgi:drug/metabolite transporter (DMT)-like permease